MILINETHFKRNAGKYYYNYSKQKPAHVQRRMRSFVRHYEKVARLYPKEIVKLLAAYYFSCGGLE